MSTIATGTSATDAFENLNSAQNTQATEAAKKEEEEKKQEQFAQYLLALKASQLTAMQQKQMQTMSSQDERTRTLEKINERNRDADDDKYNEIKDNGYTVAEMRRGLDLLRKADAQSQHTTWSTANSSFAEQAGQAFGTAAGQNGLTSQNAILGTNGEISAMMPATQFVDSGTNGTIGVTATQVLQESLQHATQQNAAIASQTSQVNQQQNQANGNTSTMRHAMASQTSVIDESVSMSGKTARHLSQQAAHQNGVMLGRTAAISLAGMTQVNTNESSKIDTELETKIASQMKTVGESKEKSSQNKLTQEALTELSNTQQSTLQHQSQNDTQNMASTNRAEAAVSQMLPNTSLLERVDQAQLTQRVASVFRSFANQKSGTIRMKLHPESLGALTIRMQIEGGEVTAKFEAETETAKQILLGNIDSLKEKLKQQNLNVKSFEIHVQPPIEKTTAQTNSQNEIKKMSAESDTTQVSRPISEFSKRVDIVG